MDRPPFLVSEQYIHDYTIDLTEKKWRNIALTVKIRQKYSVCHAGTDML
jgi:hypothetical protein